MNINIANSQVSAISFAEAAPCQIDFMRLCDKNDFAMLTDNYSTSGLIQLSSTTCDEKLRNYMLQAIISEKELHESKDDFAKTVQIMMKRNDLQKECREYYISSTSIHESQVAETSSVEAVQAGFTSRQRGFLFYFGLQALGVQIEGDVKMVSQASIKQSLVKIFGGSARTYDNHIIPFYAHTTDWLRAHEKPNNKSLQSEFEDIKYVAESIKDSIPPLYDVIAQYLDDFGR